MNNNENKLGTMPIGRLLVSMSIPMMISFFIQALYNVVDSMFVARISEDALTAVSIAFPVQQIITAIGVGTGVAVNALVPRYMGLGKQDKALRITNVSVVLSALYTILFVFIGIFGIHAYYTMQTDVPSIVQAGTQYLSVVCTVSIGAFFGQNFEKLLVATGNSVCSMIAQATGAVFNIIFDPLLIFGIGPFPKLGVTGAAAATVAGQIAAALVALGMLCWKEKHFPFHVSAMLPSPAVLKEIFSVAIPSMITVGLTSAMSFCMNQILLAFSTTATAVFGIWLKLQNFSFMPVYGMNNGTIPMISYNYGAGRLDRVRQTISLALKTSMIFILALVLVLEIIPKQLLTLFNASDNMLSIGMLALRLTLLSLPFGAVTLILSSSFQSLGYARYTLMVNLCRQLIFLVPIAWLLSLSGQLRLVWAAPILAEALSMGVTLFLRTRINALSGPLEP